VASLWFSHIPVSSTNNTDRHDITEILLKVASNTITLNLTTYTKYLFLYWPHLYQYKNGLDLWVKSASQMISLVLNSLLPCNNKLYQLTIMLLSEITNKMTPTICVSVCLQAQYRITRSILIFARIGRVHLRLIQDSGISLNFKWHVMTKTELSSANLALTIKHMKIHKSGNCTKWWMCLHIKKENNMITKSWLTWNFFSFSYLYLPISKFVGLNG
jgi:hypothetical protein